jgi:hypothetical protein
LSRIWEALKRAEQHRKRRSDATPGAAGKGGDDRRREPRVPLRVAVFVYGHGSNQEPFHEETETTGVNAYGGLLTLTTSVRHGQRLLLTNKDTRREQECHVVYVGPRTAQRVDVGIAFPDASPDFWNAEG